VRTLGRLLIGLVLLGLVAGWMLRPHLPRRRLGLVLALVFLPAALHALALTWWASGVGVAALPLAGYAAGCAVTIALAWWWLQRTAPTRPFTAPLAVPAQAFVQVAATSLLGRGTDPLGAAVDVLPGLTLLGASVAIAAALVGILPTREHFPRFGLPGGGLLARIASALGKAFGRR
jgi:hypothetical protein